jgi:DNA-binding CsgD family transcriptional regulator
MLEPSEPDISFLEEEYEQTTMLSEMEAAVTARKIHGFTHQEIADELGVKKGTVDSHAHRAREKYNLAEETHRRLNNSVFRAELPDPESTTGVVFFYDGRDKDQNGYILPAARAAANDHGHTFMTADIQSSDPSRIPDEHQVDELPAYVYYEGEVCEKWTGSDVWSIIDTDLARKIGSRTGAYDESGWVDDLSV